MIALSFVVLEYMLCRALESAVLQGHCYRFSRHWKACLSTRNCVEIDTAELASAILNFKRQAQHPQSKGHSKQQKYVWNRGKQKRLFFHHWVTVIALSFVVLEYILCRALESAVLQGHCYWSWGTGKSHANGPNRKSVEMRLLPRHWVTVTVLSFVVLGKNVVQGHCHRFSRHILVPTQYRTVSSYK